MTKLRKPNQQEKEELAAHMSTLCWDGVDDPSKEARDQVEDAAIAVFDGYISIGPGYFGKVMVVIWGWPEAYEVYIWRNGNIVQIAQDPHFQVVEAKSGVEDDKEKTTA